MSYSFDKPLNIYTTCFKQEGSWYSPIQINSKEDWDVMYTSRDDLELITSTVNQGRTDILSGTTYGAVDFIKQNVQSKTKIRIGVSREASPSGIISNSEYNKYLDKLEKDLNVTIKKNGRIDIVFMDFHGGSLVDGILEPEQQIFKKIRSIVGSETIIAVCLDPHANLSFENQKLFQDSKCIVVTYKENPHNDLIDTGARAAKYALELKSGKTFTRISAQTLKLIVPNIGKGTDKFSPLGKLLRRRIFNREGNYFADSKSKKYSILELLHLNNIDWSLIYGYVYGLSKYNINDTGFRPILLGDSKNTNLMKNLSKNFCDLIIQNPEIFEDKTMAAEKVGKSLKKSLEMSNTGLLKNLSRVSGFKKGASNKGLILVTEVSNNPGAGSPGYEVDVINKFIESGISFNYAIYSNKVVLDQIMNTYPATKEIDLNLPGYSGGNISGKFIITKLIQPKSGSQEMYKKVGIEPGKVLHKNGYFYNDYNGQVMSISAASVRLIGLYNTDGKYKPICSDQNINIIISDRRIQPQLTLCKMLEIVNLNEETNNKIVVLSARVHPWKSFEKVSKCMIQVVGKGSTTHDLVSLNSNLFNDVAKKLGITVVSRNEILDYGKPYISEINNTILKL